MRCDNYKVAVPPCDLLAQFVWEAINRRLTMA